VQRAVRAARHTTGGVVGHASAASAELGAAIVESAVAGLVRHCRSGR
jgi:creatinine amidohydrolase/Fe(II)-dependent formamide hydrolase-like protein